MSLTGLTNGLADGILKLIDNGRNVGVCLGYLTQKLVGYLRAFSLYLLPDLLDMSFGVKDIGDRTCAKNR